MGDLSGSPSSGRRRGSVAIGVPLEIIETYFSFLPPLDLICCSLVCQRWNSIIMSNPRLLAKLRCYDNVAQYPGPFDEDNPHQMKFRVFSNWDYYKRLLTFYNCSAFANFSSGCKLLLQGIYQSQLRLTSLLGLVEGTVRPSYPGSNVDLNVNWTPLRHFLVNCKLYSIVISKRKEEIKFIQNDKSENEAPIAHLTFDEPCTGCAIAICRGRCLICLVFESVFRCWDCFRAGSSWHHKVLCVCVHDAEVPRGVRHSCLLRQRHVTVCENLQSGEQPLVRQGSWPRNQIPTSQRTHYSSQFHLVLLYR